MLLMLSACSLDNHATSTTEYTAQVMPHRLDCRYVPDVALGPTWNELTIGLSTLQDVDSALSPVQGIWHEHGQYWEYLKPVSDAAQSEWYLVVACLKEDQLSALQIFPMINSGFPGTLDEWLVAYDKPDRVTWGDHLDSRSLIWAEDGLLVVVYYAATKQRIETSSIILFSPIQQNELENSWLLNSLPTKQWDYAVPTVLGDKGEDPWGIEK